ncbi:MAG TPA: prenyltransferase/squalene oxidase repeat-containing protein, partial [Gemmataceae bacterium]|nr:prenyltransferase/squalene oxidase repeat-containing protein [Gemmataceae bacterium]
MRRIGLVLVLLTSAAVRADEAADRRQTIAYVRTLQDEGGGFRPTARGTPGLRATIAAVRSLHYLGADLPHRYDAAKFVASCFDPKTGGFADTPGGKVDVFTTSVGLMSVVALRIPSERYAEPASRYLSAKAKGFEDIRIAVAGFEAIEKSPPKSAEWLAEVKRPQNADGTFGSGTGKARDTGGAVVALLRMGVKIESPEPILAALRAGQRPSGGFGKADAGEDLDSSYRILRCFAMLKAQPAHVDALRTFIAKCRNEDGGYGVAPGHPSNVGGVYYAAIIGH